MILKVGIKFWGMSHHFFPVQMSQSGDMQTQQAGCHAAGLCKEAATTCSLWHLLNLSSMWLYFWVYLFAYHFFIATLSTTLHVHNFSQSNSAVIFSSDELRTIAEGKFCFKHQCDFKNSREKKLIVFIIVSSKHSFSFVLFQWTFF